MQQLLKNEIDFLIFRVFLSRLKENRSSNYELMMKFHKDDRLVLVPYVDDRFILQYAKDSDAAVISNNDFRDLCYGWFYMN